MPIGGALASGSMAAPPLFESRSAGAQLALGVGGPAALGALCGWLLGVSQVAYTATTLALLLGALASGYEHVGSDDASVRGFLGGLVFGSVLLVTHYAIDVPALAKLPHPTGVLAVIAAIAASVFAAIGGALRRRHENRARRANTPRARATT